MPEEFEGAVTIEWPRGQPPQGWGVVIHTEAGSQLTTVTRVTVHAASDALVWAELEMFTDADGRPIYDGFVARRVPGEDGGYATAVFPFLVASMSVRESAGVAPQ
jgi:hypothetical protein